MEELQLFANMPVFDESVHFWMIRAKRGFFFDEYVSNRFIAIGWNLVKASRIKSPLTETQEKVLKEETDELDKMHKTHIWENSCPFCHCIKGLESLLQGHRVEHRPTLGNLPYS